MEASLEHSDAVLLAGFFQRGCEESFREIVERYTPVVYGAATRVLGHGPDAQDAVQAAFVALALNGRRLDASHGLGAWLHRVAFRAALDLRKSALRRQKREQEAAEMEAVSAMDDASLDEAVASLPEKIRRAIVAHYLGGWSIEEIARHEDCSASAISMRLTRGREILRKKLSAPVFAGLVVFAAVGQSAGAATTVMQAVRVITTAKSSAGFPLIELARHALRPTWRELVAPMVGGAMAVSVIVSAAVLIGPTLAEERHPQSPASPTSLPLVEPAGEASRPAKEHPLITAIKKRYRWETMNAFTFVLDQYRADLNSARDAEGKTALHWAIAKHDEEFATLMVLRGADVSAQDARGYTPLFYAVQEDMMWTVLFLALRDADVNHVAPDGRTALALAVQQGNVKLAEILLWIGAKPVPENVPPPWQPVALASASGKADMVELLNSYLQPGANVLGSENAGLPAFVRNPLHEAARRGDFPMLEKLLENGLGVNIRDENGRTALHEAISAGQAEVVFYLLMMGADANAVDNKGRSPLGATMGWLGGGLDANRRFLFAKGANPNALRQDGHTELTWAVVRDNEHGVQWLLWMGIDPQQRTQHGTPFEVAVQEGNQRIIDLLRRHGVDGRTRLSDNPIWLLDNGAKRGDLATIDEALKGGAKIDEPNAKGDTPLICAIGKRNVGAARHLLERGANLDAVNPKTGWTPLLTTVIWDYSEMTDFRKELLEAGADPNVASNSGETPLMRAVWHHPTTPLKQLIEYGADLNARDKKGRTALGRAIADGKLETADYLRSLGAQE